MLTYPSMPTLCLTINVLRSSSSLAVHVSSLEVANRYSSYKFVGPFKVYVLKDFVLLFV